MSTGPPLIDSRPPWAGRWKGAVMDECSIEGCDKPPQRVGLCWSHYRRLKRHGSPTGGRTRHLRLTSLVEYVLARSVPGPDNCIIWTGATSSHGYGYVQDDDGRNKRVHRVVYEHFVGPVPVGLMLDHTCHNPLRCVGGQTCIHRRCVNHHHLEPVTNRENVSRGHHGLRKNLR